MINNADQGAFAAAALNGNGTILKSEGLTKREYIATSILQTLSANVERCMVNGEAKIKPENVVKEALLLTDELLKALEK